MVANPLLANDEAGTELVNRLKEIESFHADFVQQASTLQGEELESQLGFVAVQRPGKFISVVTDPDELHVLIVGERLSIYDPLLEQITHTDVDAASDPWIAMLLVSPNEELLEEFAVVRQGEEFKLEPLAEDSSLTELRIEFEGALIKSLRASDHLAVNTWTFLNIKVNEEIDSDVFEIEVAPDTEVINHVQSDDEPDS